MNMDTFVAEIDAEIARLKQVRALLSGTESPAVAKKRGRPAGVVTAAAKPAKAAKKKAKRTLSPEARKAIGDAQKKRWAKIAAQKKAAAKATAKPAAKAAKKAGSKPTVKKAPAKKALPKVVKPVEPSTPQQ